MLKLGPITSADIGFDVYTLDQVMLPSLHLELLSSTPRPTVCIADLRGANGCHRSSVSQSSSVWCQELLKHSLANYRQRKGRSAARSSTILAATTSADAFLEIKDQQDDSFSHMHHVDSTQSTQAQPSKQKPIRRVRRRVDNVAEADSQSTETKELNELQPVNQQDSNMDNDSTVDNVDTLPQASGTKVRRGRRINAEAEPTERDAGVTKETAQNSGVRVRRQSNNTKGEAGAWGSLWDVSDSGPEASQQQRRSSRAWVRSRDGSCSVERASGETDGSRRVLRQAGGTSATEAAQQQNPRSDSSRSNRKQMMMGGAAAVAAVGAGAAIASQSQQKPKDNDTKGSSTQTASSTQQQDGTGKGDAATPRVEISNDILQIDDKFIKDLESRAAETSAEKLTTVAQYLREQLQQRGRYWPATQQTSSNTSTLPQEDQDGLEGDSADHRVYRSEVELVNDIVDTLLGVRLPPKAFYGARAEDLSKLAADVDQCKAQCRLWITACDKQLAKEFIAREPRLLVLSPDSLLLSLHAISTCMNLQDPAATLDWALRNSTLLQTGLTQEHLNSRLDEISNVLGIDREKAIKVAKRHTILLTYASGDLVASFDVLSHLLPIDKKRLTTVLQHEPGLLSKSPVTVAGKLLRLAAILHVSLQDAALVYAGQPGLLRLAEDRLKARWERLQFLAARHQPWQQQLQTMPPQRLGRCLAVPETIVNRLAFLINKNMQALPVVQDLKRVLTCSTTHFKNTLLVALRKGGAGVQAGAGPHTDK